jgi:hypothetical protein
VDGRVEKKTPVPVTRGSGNQFLSQKLHWIEGTFKGRNVVSLPQTLPSKFVETRAFNGYTVGSLYEDGRILMTNPERPEMGTHIQWSGDACDNCSIDHKALINHLINANFSFTRLDMAIDAVGFNLRPERATEEIDKKCCKTRAKSAPRQDDAIKTGYTQYVGKKTSEIFLKLYDKAAEMGTDEDHCRIELTTRHARADSAARKIVSGVDFRAMVIAYADFPLWREWQDIMAVVPVKLPSERGETNTEQWLLGACAPALARVIYFEAGKPQKPDFVNFYEKFKDAVMMNLEDLSNGRRTVH